MYPVIPVLATLTAEILFSIALKTKIPKCCWASGLPLNQASLVILTKKSEFLAKRATTKGKVSSKQISTPNLSP